jgi:hypothetical protein
MFYALVVPSAVFAFPGFFAGAIAPRAWICLALAECLALVGLGYLYVIGGSLLQDELTIRGFLHFLINSEHATAFAVMGSPVLAGHLMRRWAMRKTRSG